MADRLRFKFIRIAQIGQVGEAAIDVLDPTDADEIYRKLQSRDFVEFLPQEQEFDEEQWSYEVLQEEMVSGPRKDT